MLIEKIKLYDALEDWSYFVYLHIDVDRSIKGLRAIQIIKKLSDDAFFKNFLGT